jgi:hypothetical protein
MIIHVLESKPKKGMQVYITIICGLPITGAPFKTSLHSHKRAPEPCKILLTAYNQNNILTLKTPIDELIYKENCHFAGL